MISYLAIFEPTCTSNPPHIKKTDQNTLATPWLYVMHPLKRFL